MKSPKAKPDPQARARHAAALLEFLHQRGLDPDEQQRVLLVALGAAAPWNIERLLFDR